MPSAITGVSNQSVQSAVPNKLRLRQPMPAYALDVDNLHFRRETCFGKPFLDCVHAKEMIAVPMRGVDDRQILAGISRPNQRFSGFARP